MSPIHKEKRRKKCGENEITNEVSVSMMLRMKKQLFAALSSGDIFLPNCQFKIRKDKNNGGLQSNI